MKFKYGQNHTVVQTIKNKVTGVTNRFAVCKFDDNGELETTDKKIIHVLQNHLPGCTWEGKEIEAEKVVEILSDTELRTLAKRKGIKSSHNKSISKIKKELEDIKNGL